MKYAIRICTALFALLSLTSPASADSANIGDYTVHYIAVNSTFLTPEIARQYDIERNRRTAFLNIAILHNDSDGGTSPVTAKVSGGKSNLMQQSSTVKFQEIREGEAIYYIGQFTFSDAEILRFDIEVQPESKGVSHKISWTSQLYASE